MGLVDNSTKSARSTIYYEVLESRKNFRPLLPDTVSLWTHTVPGIKETGADGSAQWVRKFHSEACVRTSKTATNCVPCNMQDPLWDKLDDRSKHNSKGKRVDFPMRIVHLLPVFDPATNKVLVLKGGNGMFEDMGTWLKAQPEARRDLRRCDWQVSKTGKELFTKYHMLRMDESPFQFTPELEAEAKAALDQAMKDMAPMEKDAFIKMVSGVEDTDNMGKAQAWQPPGTNSTTPPWESSSLPTPPPPAPPPVQLPPPPQISTPFAQANSIGAPPKQAVVAPPPANASLDSFNAWLKEQPELTGAGMLDHLVPVLQAEIGSVNYFNATPEQLARIRAAIELKLAQVRR